MISSCVHFLTNTISLSEVNEIPLCLWLTLCRVRFLADSAAVNADGASVIWVPKSRIAGSWIILLSVFLTGEAWHGGSHIVFRLSGFCFVVFRNFHLDFSSGHVSFIASRTLTSICCFLLIAVLSEVRWNLKALLICISYFAKDLGYFL